MQNETGVYDYGTRFFDPEIAKLMDIDPKTEANPNWSDYNYALNNPLKYIDTNDEDVYLTI